VMPPNITICNSEIFQSSGNIGIGTTTPAATLDVNGAVNAATSFDLGGSAFAFGTFSNQNAFLGFSGNSTMTGADNTATGVDALQNNTSGFENTASGVQALYSNNTGFDNTATGLAALQMNTSGQENTATGVQALQYNMSGSLNTATGRAALYANTNGSNNTADGWKALGLNTMGSDNAATGYGALTSNTTGGSNTAAGMLALQFNTTGNNNTAGGFLALDYNATGNYNTALGQRRPCMSSPSLEVQAKPGVMGGWYTARGAGRPTFKRCMVHWKRSSSSAASPTTCRRTANAKWE
jgi:trimeric autotransporter adhesin